MVRGRLRFFPAFAIVFGVAAALRFHGAGRALWTGEAWVANSVLAPRLGEMFYYPAWLQSTPPLFLLLVRGAVRLFGISNYSFRLAPFCFGLLALALHLHLSRRLFAPPAALLCTAIAAFSPIAIIYAKELKQYSSDWASTAIILLAVWTYVTRPDRRAFAAMVAAFAVLPWLSHTAVMLAPLAAGCILAVPPAKGKDGGQTFRRVAGVRFLVLSATVLVTGALNYVFFIRPNRAAHLDGFWGDGFPDTAGIRALARYYRDNGLQLAAFPFPGANTLVHGVKSAPAFAQALMAAALAGIVAVLAVRFRKSRRHIALAAFSVAPALTLGVFNLLRLYPVSAPRLLLFLLPCNAIGFTLLLESLWEAGLPAFVATDAGRRWLAGVAVAFTAVMCAAALRAGAWEPWQREDTESAIRELKADADPGDRVYVHGSVVEPARLYEKMLGWDSSGIIYGRSGRPCCPREVHDARQDGAILHAEAGELGRTARGHRLWLLFTARAEHWQYLRRGDPDYIIGTLQRDGCRPERKLDFPDVSLYRFSCGSTAPSR